MKITNILSEAKIDDSDLAEVIQCHPRQIISSELEIPVWKIEYSYDTQRGNHREAVKYLFLEDFSWDRVENEFMQHINTINEKYPERKLSNVKILDANFMGKLKVELE
jgi:hypothetical protein